MVSELNKIYQGHVHEVLKGFPADIVQTIVTSPPYWMLRNYGLPETDWPEVKYMFFGIEVVIPEMSCCLGLEPTPQQFIGHLILIFREAKRVLKSNGTIWVNMGDSYCSTAPGSMGDKLKQTGILNGISYETAEARRKQRPKTPLGMKPKDLVGIPWMLAFALREDGWYLRQDIIWNKPNPMPESAIDRCTKAHEYIFLLSKSPKYYYNAKAIATPYKDKTLTTYRSGFKSQGDGSGLVQSENWANSLTERKPKEWKTPDGWDTGKGTHGNIHKNGREKGQVNPRNPREGVDTRGGNQGSVNGIPAVSAKYNFRRENSKREEPILGQSKGTHRPDREDSRPDGLANKRSVWTVGTKPFKEAHFATFPTTLIEDCIKAGCPEKGIVMDIFMGSGTTAVVAGLLNRKWIGIDLSEKYINEIALPRIHKSLGLFK